VAIESGMWRSGRIGGAAGSATVGNGRFREDRGGTRSRGGNRLPLGDQEPVGGDAQRGVVVEAAPTAPLVVPEAEFLLQFLVVALDPPAQLGAVDQLGEGDVIGQVDSQYLVGSASPSGHSTSNHSSGLG